MLYREAYERAKGETLRDRLLLTRFLIETRESDEDIPDRAAGDSLATLCAGPLTDRQAVLCALAPRYIAGPSNRALQQAARIDRSLFDLDQSPLDAYIYTLCARTYGIKESAEETEARWDRFINSPLFIYLDFARQVARKATELEKSHPQFAELYAQMAETHFQKARYTRARSCFRKALELIPDYTRAINGLGNICFYALEDYEKALEQYESTLGLDPLNTAALYGKGTALHNLNKYAESNTALDLMLQSDISRRGRADETAIRYYQGEAHFYKAYNFHLTGDSSKARDLVDTARRYIPESESVNYLSGVIYFKSQQYRPALDDFQRALRTGHANCDAQYYMGRIYREWEDVPITPPSAIASDALARNREIERYLKLSTRAESRQAQALNHFLRACSCMDSTVRGYKDRIASLPSMDIEEVEKVLLKGRIEKKLFNYRLTASSLIEDMMSKASDADVPNRNVYVDAMSEILARVRPSPDTPSERDRVR